jgi:hypothetical protein
MYISQLKIIAKYHRNKVQTTIMASLSLDHPGANTIGSRLPRQQGAQPASWESKQSQPQSPKPVTKVLSYEERCDAATQLAKLN